MGRRRLTIGRGTISWVLAALLMGVAAVAAQAPPAATSHTTTSALTRPCSANPVLASAPNKKKSSRKLQNPLPPEPAPTCIELKGQAIEVQEFLQNTARKQAWQIAENRTSEDTWSYVRYLGPEELDKFTDTKVLVESVSFSSGKAAVIVRTTDLAEGYVRVQISAHFRGEGQSNDKISPQPATVWPLSSKGVLEQDLVAALQSGYKQLQ
jgi:hypothetical protein